LALIVVDASRFDLGLRILNREELMDVQALVAQSPFDRFPGLVKSTARPT
jgi:hypothetical protein